MTTQDFDTWLESTDLSDFNDVYSLYHSVSELEQWAGFSTVQAPNGAYILNSVDTGENLCMSTVKSRDAFLKKIEADYCDGMDIESWYSFHHAMEKDD